MKHVYFVFWRIMGADVYQALYGNYKGRSIAMTHVPDIFPVLTFGNWLTISAS